LRGQWSVQDHARVVQRRHVMNVLGQGGGAGHRGPHAVVLEALAGVEGGAAGRCLDDHGRVDVARRLHHAVDRLGANAVDGRQSKLFLFCHRKQGLDCVAGQNTGGKLLLQI
jgi:hypothetical protein